MSVSKESHRKKSSPELKRLILIAFLPAAPGREDSDDVQSGRSTERTFDLPPGRLIASSEVLTASAIFAKLQKGNNPLNWLVIITATKPGGFGSPAPFPLSFFFYLPSLLSSWPVSCGATNTSYHSCSFQKLIKRRKNPKSGETAGSADGG